MSQQWMKNAEQDIPDAQAYDWTYSSGYQGNASSIADDSPIEPSETADRIDFESLKVSKRFACEYFFLLFCVCAFVKNDQHGTD
jgi:hypothetical protein